MYGVPEHCLAITVVVSTFFYLLSVLFNITGIRISFLYIYEKDFTVPLNCIFLHTYRHLFCTKNFVFFEGSGKKYIQCAI
jgi:hypothetical protein